MNVEDFIIGPLKAFSHYGVDFTSKVGNQLVGTCVFCTKENHFYVNKDKYLWDCKSCLLNGNFNTFLKCIWETYRNGNLSDSVELLSKWKGINKLILWRSGWIYNYDTDEFLLPVKDQNSYIVDLRRYNENYKGIYSTPGCKSGLWGLEKVKKADTIWLCEGETDAIKTNSLLKKCGKTTKEIAVSVPGAGVFKKSWINFFNDKIVFVGYDNDKAGNEGVKKVIKLLNGSVKALYELKWTKNKPKGWDIKDEISRLESKYKSSTKIYKTVKKKFSDIRTSDLKNKESKKEELDKKIIAVGESSWTWEETLNVFQQHIEMRKEMIDLLWFIFAHAFSVSQGGDPLWSFIVGPSGCGKTMLLLSLSGSERCLFRSAITPRSLVSGWVGKNGTDPSQLPKWNNYCTILKDFTEILATNQQIKEDLYGVLRGAYDGEVIKSFGNGITRHYAQLHFGFVAGVTPAIHSDPQASMGERFLKFEVFRDVGWSAEKEIRAALKGVGRENTIQKDLQEASGRLLARDINGLDAPIWSNKLIDKLVNLSQLIGWLRATVEREKGWEQKVIQRPTHEMGTRLAKQLYKLGQNLAIVKDRKRVGNEEYAILERCACDTARGWNLDIVSQLCDSGGELVFDELKERLSLHWRTLGHSIDDLVELKVVKTYRGKKRVGHKGQKPRYVKISRRINSLWKNAKISKRLISRIKKGFKKVKARYSNE